MITKFTLPALIFILLSASCNKAEHEATLKQIGRGTNSRISGPSAGEIHNYIVNTYMDQFSFDPDSNVSRTEFDSMLHRCMYIAIADSIVVDGNPDSTLLHTMHAMDSLGMFDQSGNCKSQSDWQQVCEASITHTGFRLAVHNINRCQLTDTAFLSYADDQLQNLSGLSQQDSVAVAGYASVLHHSLQNWSNSAKGVIPTKEQAVKIAANDAAGFAWKYNQYSLAQQLLLGPYVVAVSTANAADWSLQEYKVLVLHQ